MAFDLTSAKPESSFDLGSAKPETSNSTEDKEYLDYVSKQKSLSSRAQIPRYPGDMGEEYPVLSKEDWKKQKQEAFVKGGIEGLKGIGETGLSLTTAFAAPFLAPASMAGRGIMSKLLPDKVAPSRSYEDTIDDLTYSPKGEVGSKYVGEIGMAAQALPPFGSYVNAPALIRAGRGKPKPIAEPLRPVPSATPPENVPQRTEKGLLLDNVPQEVKDQQSFYNKQGQGFDLSTARPVDEPMSFEKQPGQLRVEQIPEDIRQQQSLFNQEETSINRGDLSRQEGLPFTDSVEAVREAQVRGSPQPDMFVQENQLQRSFDPYQENLRKQADAERMDLERVAEESRKQQEMDAMLAKRQQDLFQEEQARKQENVADALSRVEERMNAKERPSTFRRNELGAIDIDAVQEAINKFRSGETGGRAVVEAFRGAFTDNEYAKLYTALNDPKGKDTVVLLSPQQFHSLAAGRRPHEIAEWGPKLYPEIKQGLKGEGLWDMPHLLVDKKGQVWAHEGRHRMDVFKEMNVGMVPVRFRAKDFNWGEHRPEKLYTEDVKNAVDLSPEVRRAYAHPMPEILSRKEGEPKYTLSGLGKNQRGVLDTKVFEDLFPAFKNSIARNPDGSLKVYYHGTSADKDFVNFKNKGNGIWLTEDTRIANMYADSNDSQVSKYNRETGKFEEQNTASRVIPVYVNIKNTKLLTSEERRSLNHENYTQKQKALFSKLEKEGYDSADVMGALVVFDPANVKSALTANNRPLTNWSQRGVIDLNAISEGISKLARLGKNSSEIAPFVQEATRDKAREVVYNKIPNLEPFRSNIKTAEDVLARLDDPEYKDLSDTQLATGVSVKPGSRTVRVTNNNPLVAFRQHTAMETMAQADNFAREYITGKDGVGPIWEKLPEKEQVELHRVLRVGDAEQRRFTPEELAEAGYTPKQIEFMEKYYKMEDFKLDLWNEQRLAIGMDPVAPRQGHFSSVFRGDFWSLVMEPDEKGNPRIVGFVGTDTKAGYNSVIEGLKKENSNYTFTPMKRRGLTGSFRRSDLAQGMSEMMEWLGQNDPRLEQIRQQIIDITSRNADAWLGADLHALDKKGIWGNEGNKPWEKDAGRASSEAMRAYLASWEEGVLSHLNLKPNAELTALLANPEVANKWPNAAAYVNRYSKHMTGTYTSQLAATVNNAVDLTTRVVSFNQLGPSSVRGAVNEYTKRMGQLTQGFANIVYTGMQWLQPFMTAMPEMYRAGNTINIGASAVTGFTDSLKYIRHMLDPNTELSPFQKEMFKFAEDKGLLTFSEYDDVSKVTQNKVSRNLDNAIDFNRNQLGERPTRPFVFFTFVDLLRKHETLPESEIFDTAYNLTQYSMTDYHPSERPMMYRELGVVGQLAGSLSQFKHSYTNQMIQWGKEVGKKPQMAIAGLAAVLTLSGYRGLPGYDDADAIVKWLTNKFGDKQVSIADIVSQNGPEWLAYEPVAYGALSAATGVNFSSRLGSAQLSPQTIPEAISPYAGKGIRLGEHALSIGTNPKALTNLGIEAAPSTVRGLLEDQLSTTDSGMLQNKKGQNEYQRTEFDRSVRRFGLTSLEESKARDKVYQGTQNKMKDDEARAKITGEAILKFNQLGKEWLKSEEFQKMRETYQKRGGDPTLLIEAIIQGKQEAGLTGKQRAEGINPDSLGSINRYKYFNDK